jgi:hypothetical protein
VLEAQITADLPLRLFTLAAPGKMCCLQSRGRSLGAEIYDLRANGGIWNVELSLLERRSSKTVSNVMRIEPAIDGSSNLGPPIVSTIISAPGL